MDMSPTINYEIRLQNADPSALETTKVSRPRNSESAVKAEDFDTIKLPLVDLNAQNVMDDILGNLQNLTPEQEDLKRQIEERSRLVFQQAKQINRNTTFINTLAATEMQSHNDADTDRYTD